MKRSHLSLPSFWDQLGELSPVEIFGLLLVALGVLCLLALACTGCGGSPFEAGLGAAPDAPDAAPLAPDAGLPEVPHLSPGPEAAVEAPAPPEAAQAPDGGLPEASRDAADDRPEKQFAPEAAAPDAAPEASPPPPDPACLRCAITCSSSALSYPCAGAGASAPVSCGHPSYAAGDPACTVAGACAVGGPCGTPENPACWGGTVVYARGPSCP